MDFGEIVKSKVFIISFVILEIIAFIFGSFITWQALCIDCPVGQICPPCPSGNYALEALLLFSIPNVIIAFVVSVLVKRLRRS